jgi:hypothetical protein
MKSFVVQDVKGLLKHLVTSEYRTDDVGIDWDEATRNVDQVRPVRMYQDGIVRAEGKHTFEIVNSECPFARYHNDDDFNELWETFGYPDVKIEE